MLNCRYTILVILKSVIYSWHALTFKQSYYSSDTRWIALLCVICLESEATFV